MENYSSIMYIQAESEQLVCDHHTHQPQLDDEQMMEQALSNVQEFWRNLLDAKQKYGAGRFYPVHRIMHKCLACGGIFGQLLLLVTHTVDHITDESKQCGLCGERLCCSQGLMMHLPGTCPFVKKLLKVSHPRDEHTTLDRGNEMNKLIRHSSLATKQSSQEIPMQVEEVDDQDRLMESEITQLECGHHKQDSVDDEQKIHEALCNIQEAWRSIIDQRKTVGATRFRPTFRIMHHCMICESVFGQMSTLIGHIAEHVLDEQIQCGLCAENLCCSEDLKLHLRGSCQYLINYYRLPSLKHQQRDAIGQSDKPGPFKPNEMTRVELMELADVDDSDKVVAETYQTK